MSLKTIIVLVVSALWFWAAQYRYTCVINNACGDEPPDSTKVVEEYQEEFGPLSFKYNDPKAYTSPINFQALKDSILKGNTGDNLLELTGLYFKEETTPEGHENMGVARAKSLRALLIDSIAEERIRIVHREVEINQTPDNPFKGIDYKWTEVVVEKAEVVVLEDRAVMFFPVNSTGMENDPKIDAYFTEVAANIKTTGEKIHLTGHTDNTGNKAANQNLGLQRAKAIQNILLSKGVDKSLISSESKGQSQPVATNETEAGRHQNRRVELRLIKQ